MANEISISIAVSISKLGVTNQLSKSLNRDLVGNNQISHVQTVGTTAELLIIGDLSNIKRLCVLNLSPDNPVSLGLDSDADPAFAELAPDDIAFVPLPAGVTAIYAKATGGNADIAVLACET